MRVGEEASRMDFQPCGWRSGSRTSATCGSRKPTPVPIGVQRFDIVAAATLYLTRPLNSNTRAKKVTVRTLEIGTARARRAAQKCSAR
jgi:hypothetical protein